MAPVGQTSEHRVHLSWQWAMLKFITGVHSASKPPSLNVAGCSTLVGQALMHWSHLMHLARNSASATEPGGRIRSGEKFASLESPLLRSRGKASTPSTPENTSLRRDRSGAGRTWLRSSPSSV